MLEELTDAQQRVFDFIVRSTEDEGAPPTYRAIAENFGFKSTRAAQDHVAALTRKGYLEHIPGVSRGLRITPEAAGPKADSFSVPILGVVGASAPRESWQVDMGAIPFPRSGSKGARDAEKELYALRVKGESMVEAGIFEGDIIIVRAQKTAAHGDIIVAMVDNESTVKRLSKVNGKISLIPENRKMKPIHVAPGELVIQGKVVGVQRVYR